MSLRLIAVVIVAIGLSALPAGADDGALPSHLSVTSGPPGTIVTVSDVAACPTAMTVGWAGDNLFAVAPLASSPFTPPSGTTTVPSLPNGTYRIVLSCGDGRESLPFEIVGSSVAQPVVAAPVFTG